MDKINKTDEELKCEASNLTKGDGLSLVDS